MGNTQQNQPVHARQNQRLPGNICLTPNQIQSSVRCSIGESLPENANAGKLKHAGISRESRACKSMDCKGKQKLSLSKEVQSQSSMRLHLKRSASNDCRGIGLTQVEKTVSEYRQAIVINRPAPRVSVVENNQKIVKGTIRPKDLPRRVSTEKVIIFPQSTIKRVPLEPRIVINPPASTPCIINFPKQQPEVLATSHHSHSHSHHSLQSSIVTPFVPPKNIQNNQYFLATLQPKKLKKVAMNRSHTNYNICERGQNNGQEQQINKQNEKKEKGHSILAESRFQDEVQRQQLFTDPKLYAYITNKDHPFASQIKVKYALPTSDKAFQSKIPSIESKRSNNFIYANPTEMNPRPATTVPQRLQQAIPEEVQSKPLIQGEMFRFPTLTDFSEDTKTDNTSFIPIRNNSSKKHYLEGEELLKYCRPRIDEMVLADLQKLPIKN